jgi:hypothetical protein
MDATPSLGVRMFLNIHHENIQKTPTPIRSHGLCKGLKDQHWPAESRMPEIYYVGSLSTGGIALPPVNPYDGHVFDSRARLGTFRYPQVRMSLLGRGDRP